MKSLVPNLKLPKHGWHKPCPLRTRPSWYGQVGPRGGVGFGPRFFLEKKNGEKSEVRICDTKIEIIMSSFCTLVLLGVDPCYNLFGRFYSNLVEVDFDMTFESDVQYRFSLKKSDR